MRANSTPNEPPPFTAVQIVRLFIKIGTTLYPALHSLRALHSGNAVAQRRWLKYWTLLGSVLGLEVMVGILRQTGGWEVIQSIMGDMGCTAGTCGGGNKGVVDDRYGRDAGDQANDSVGWREFRCFQYKEKGGSQDMNCTSTNSGKREAELDTSAKNTYGTSQERRCNKIPKMTKATAKLRKVKSQSNYALKPSPRNRVRSRQQQQERAVQVPRNTNSSCGPSPDNTSEEPIVPRLRLTARDKVFVPAKPGRCGDEQDECGTADEYLYADKLQETVKLTASTVNSHSTRKTSAGHFIVHPPIASRPHGPVCPKRTSSGDIKIVGEFDPSDTRHTTVSSAPSLTDTPTLPQATPAENLSGLAERRRPSAADISILRQPTIPTPHTPVIRRAAPARGQSKVSSPSSSRSPKPVEQKHVKRKTPAWTPNEDVISPQPSQVSASFLKNAENMSVIERAKALTHYVETQPKFCPLKERPQHDVSDLMANTRFDHRPERVVEKPVESAVTPKPDKVSVSFISSETTSVRDKMLALQNYIDEQPKFRPAMVPR